MRRNKEWTIYMHISPNGKMYIGQTSRINIEKRFKGGRGYKHNKMFSQDIKYYGWDAFEHKILYKHISTQEEADKIEIRLINELDLMNPNKGYNIMSGGSGKAHTNGKYNVERKKIIDTFNEELNKEYDDYITNPLTLEFRQICA